jgi:hypothetical protein
VGAGGSGHPQDQGPGELSAFPRARWNRDGGWSDWLGAESITIMPYPGFPTLPYYNLTPADRYDFFVTDYGSGYLNSDACLLPPLGQRADRSRQFRREIGYVRHGRRGQYFRHRR